MQWTGQQVAIGVYHLDPHLGDVQLKGLCPPGMGRDLRPKGDQLLPTTPQPEPSQAPPNRPRTQHHVEEVSASGLHLQPAVITHVLALVQLYDNTQQHTH